jgi:hypothetical protein
LDSADGTPPGQNAGMKRLLVLAMSLFVTGATAQQPAEQPAAARFGEAIAQAFNDRDEKALGSLIDLRGLGIRAAKVQGLPPRQQEQFVRGAESAGMSRIAASYFQTMNASQGSAQFMRVTNTSPERVLIRLDLGENGVDYLEYVVESREGRTRAVDWFQLSTGELMSVTIGGIAQMFTSEDSSLLGRLLGVEQVDKESMGKLHKVGNLQRSGKYAEALALLRTLPDPIASSRLMLSAQASMAALSKQDAEYSRVLAKLAEKYSDDPATAFKLVDHYFFVKDRPKLLKALDTMERRVGVDGVTSHLRAAAHIVTGDPASGLKFADEAIRLEPDRLAGYDIRASALVGLGRFADAISQYRDIEKRFEIEFTRDVFENDPLFAKFVASPAFRRWFP